MLDALFVAASIISKGDKTKLMLVSVLTIGMNLFDLAAVAFIGITGALAIRGIQNQGSGDRVYRILELLGIADLDIREQVIFTGSVALFILIARSITSYYTSKRIYVFMGRSANRISLHLLEQIMRRDISFLQKRSLQENVYATTSGVSSLMVGLVGSAVIITTDLSLFLILFAGMFFIDIWTGLLILFLSVTVGVLLQLKLGRHSNYLGKTFGDLSVSANQKIMEMFTSFREVTIRKTSKHYLGSIFDTRESLVQGQSAARAMPLMSKYVFEVLSILLIMTITIIQFTFNDPARAIGNIAFFLAASSRVIPAVLRVQQNLLTMMNSAGTAQKTLALIKDLQSEITSTGISSQPTEKNAVGFEPSLVLKQVYFQYSNQDSWALENIIFDIPSYSSLGIVGPTGSGKSTLVDLMLGLITPNRGTISLSGMKPRDAINLFPGQISYVPQNVVIHNTTLIENLLLGVPRTEVDFSWLRRIIQTLGLKELLETFPKGLEHELQGQGSSLSGGEKQKIGIARALLTKPRLLVLDESTSALDSMSESLVSEFLQGLQVQTTIIVVAHRLSTIRSLDSLVYLDNGRLLAQGSFDYLKKSVSDFEKQVLLMSNPTV